MEDKQRPPRGQNGHRWYTGLHRCPKCRAYLQTDGYGDEFCMTCGWYNTEFARAGLHLYQRLAHEMLPDPDRVVHMELQGDT